MNAIAYDPPYVEQLPTELRFLLGDPGDPNLLLSAWPDDVQKRLDDAPESPELQFEFACACLYDSRLYEAKRFFLCDAPSQSPLGQALPLLGQGKVYNLQGLLTAADHCLRNAVNLLRNGDRGPAWAVTVSFYLLNCSDLGIWPEDAKDLRDWLESARLEGAAEAVRMHSLGRLMLRTGRKREALEVLENYWNGPDVENVPALYRAHVARLVGALLTMNGRPLAARYALKEALNLFTTIDYRRGVVRTALSLARTYGSLDVEQARFYVSMVGRILTRHTNHPKAQRAHGRTMPKEWSDFYARSGDVAFASGQFDEARTQYELDVATLKYLCDQRMDRLAREAAHAYRNLGRAVLALQHPGQAADHFANSALLFERAGDQLGEFYSLAHRCRAQLKGDMVPEAAVTLERLKRMARAYDGPKENAIVDLLDAHLLWVSKDHLAAQRALYRAKGVFELRRDHYYLFTLLLEARIFSEIGDWDAARSILCEAWRRSSSAELADVRKEVEARFPDVSKDSVSKADLTFLQQRCNQEQHVRADLTILFADIRGFTDLCTQIDPQQMASFIKDFAKLVSTSVSRNDGLPVRFLGDCVMALFGAREEDEPTSVRLALEAAQEVYELFCGLRDRWAEHTPLFRDVGLGCGIASGTVVAGTFGASGLSEFSVIGAPVNLASRIQGIAADGKIMLCPRTAELAARGIGLFGTESVHEFKGFKHPVSVSLVTVSNVAAKMRARENAPVAVPQRHSMLRALAPR